jgi:phosphoglycolate phosphatase
VREPVRAVLFDFDFTLGDSSAGIFECVRFACEGCGCAAPGDEAVRPLIGLSLPEVHARLLNGAGGERGRRAFVEAFHRRADEVMEARTVMLPGAVEAVRALRERGVRTGVVTTKFRRRIEEIAAKRSIADLFDVIVGLEDVPAPKPDPSGLRVAMDRLRVARDEVVYVGDHEVDALAAAAAGVRFLGVPTGTTGAERFRSMGCICIASLAELPELWCGHAPGAAGS